MWKYAACFALLIPVLINIPAFGQDSPPSDPLAEKASEILKNEIGNWTSTWEWFGEDGEIAVIQEGTEEFTFTLGESVIEMRTAINGNIGSTALRFYNPVDKKIIVVAVGQDGDHWTLREDVETRIVQSNPHLLPDGSVMTLRWTPQKISKDEMILLMERSLDNGETWTKGNIQTMRKIKQE